MSEACEGSQITGVTLNAFCASKRRDAAQSQRKVNVKGYIEKESELT